MLRSQWPVAFRFTPRDRTLDEEAPRTCSLGRLRASARNTIRKTARRRLPSSVPVGLEGKFAAHLDGSWTAVGAGNLAKGGGPERAVWLSPDGQVERVEAVKGELRGISLLESDFLEDRHVGSLIKLGANRKYVFRSSSGRIFKAAA